MLRGNPSPPAPLPRGEGKNTNTSNSHATSLPLLPLPVGEGWGEGFTTQQKVRARVLRQQSTDAENLLWSKLRNRQLGVKFRRQHPIGYYFADFACVEAGLVIELDGSQHTDYAALEYDEIRKQVMESAGFQTLRFWNHDVLHRTPMVLERIVGVLAGRTLTPAPLPRGEGSNTNNINVNAASLPSLPLPVGEGWGEGSRSYR